MVKIHRQASTKRMFNISLRRKKYTVNNALEQIQAVNCNLFQLRKTGFCFILKKHGILISELERLKKEMARLAGNFPEETIVALKPREEALLLKKARAFLAAIAEAREKGITI